MFKFAALCLLFGPMAWSGTAAGDERLASPRSDFGMTVEHVLDRLERYERIDAGEAEVWRSGLRQMDSAAALMELALLEIYGPESVRDPVRGLERLEQLQDGGLPTDIRKLLRVLGTHVSAELRHQRDCAELAARLEQAQLAHAETRDKLEALRQIERQLETEVPGEISDSDQSTPEQGGQR